MKNFLYNNISWFIFYTIMLSLELTGLIGLIKKISDPRGRVGVGEGKLPQEIFHVLCGVIFSALVLNIVLIYFQMWRPFKAKQQDRNEDIEGWKKQGGSSCRHKA